MRWPRSKNFRRQSWATGTLWRHSKPASWSAGSDRFRTIAAAIARELPAGLSIGEYLSAQSRITLPDAAKCREHPPFHELIIIDYLFDLGSDSIDRRALTDAPRKFVHYAGPIAKVGPHGSISAQHVSEAETCLDLRMFWSLNATPAGF